MIPNIKSQIPIRIFNFFENLKLHIDYIDILPLNPEWRLILSITLGIMDYNIYLLVSKYVVYSWYHKTQRFHAIRIFGIFKIFLNIIEIHYIVMLNLEWRLN